MQHAASHWLANDRSSAATHACIPAMPACMPAWAQVQLVSEGDIISDLYMVVEGQVEVISGYEESQSGKASSVFEGSAHGTDTEPSVRGRESSFVDRTQRTNIHSRWACPFFCCCVTFSTYAVYGKLLRHALQRR